MKSDKKTSIRLPSKRLEELDKICSENDNCSRAKVIKGALNLVINGKSGIKFDTQINYSENQVKTLVIEHDNKGNIKNSFEMVIEEN